MSFVFGTSARLWVVRLIPRCGTTTTVGTSKPEIRSKHMKGSKERLFIMTQTQNLHIFGVIPFVRLQMLPSTEQ